MKIPQIERILRAIMLDDLSVPNLVKLIEKEVAGIYPYDHEQKNVPKACNVTIPESFAIKMGRSDEGIVVSKMVEEIEATLSKRQLALAFVSAIVKMKESGITPESFNAHDHDDENNDSESEMRSLRDLARGGLPNPEDLTAGEMMQIISILEKAKRRK